MADSRHEPPRQWIRDALARHERALIVHARRITGDLDRARDAVQETFLRLCGRPRDEVEAHLDRWLFTVCRNAAIDRCKKEGGMPSTNPGETLEMPGTEPEPSAAVTAEETRSSLRATLARLPKNQQDVLRLKFESGLSYKEIQHVTGLSVGNVGYLIHVALRSLRERLSGDALEEQLS